MPVLVKRYIDIEDSAELRVDPLRDLADTKDDDQCPRRLASRQPLRRRWFL